MVVFLAAIGVLLAGAMLPLAFEDSDDGDTQENVSQAEPASEEADGDLLADAMALMPPDSPDEVSEPVPIDEGVLASEAADAPDVYEETEDLVPDIAQPPFAFGQAVSTDIETQPSDAPFPEDTDDLPRAELEGESPKVEREYREGRMFLNGSNEDDTMDVPHRAHVLGGHGADSFQLDAHTPVGEQASLADFDPESDRLSVVWDDAAHADPPQIKFGTIEDADDMCQLIVDGVVIAHVADGGALTPADVELVPRSSL